MNWFLNRPPAPANPEQERARIDELIALLARFRLGPQVPQPGLLGDPTRNASGLLAAQRPPSPLGFPENRPGGLLDAASASAATVPSAAQRPPSHFGFPESHQSGLLGAASASAATAPRFAQVPQQDYFGQPGAGLLSAAQQPPSLLGFPENRPGGLWGAGSAATVPRAAQFGDYGLLSAPQRPATMADFPANPTTVIDRSPHAGRGATEIAVAGPQPPANPPIPKPRPDIPRLFRFTTLGQDSHLYGYGDGPEARTARQGTIEALMGVDADWHGNGESRTLGIGDMSLPGLASFGTEHSGHLTGREVDIRPVRKDGREEPVDFNNPAYDQAATQRLVDILRARGATTIYFNDPNIRGVTPLRLHDDHLHAFFGNAR